MTPDEAIGTLTGVGQAGEDAAAEPSGEWLVIGGCPTPGPWQWAAPPFRRQRDGNH